MPQEHNSRREIIAAVKSLPALADLTSIHEGHFDYELDLEVIVYGRNYNGKKVGPYVRLLSYNPGELIIKEGDWGGNTFYFVVKGEPEVFLKSANRGELKVAQIPPGRQFGEMSVLAGVPRSATVRAPDNESVQLLEMQRPALRLLRKLSKFNESLDRTYLNHGRKSAFQEMDISSHLSDKMIEEYFDLSQFKVYSKNHVLFSQNAPIDNLYIIKEGWLQRSYVSNPEDQAEEQYDYLGNGYCFGLEGITKRQARWPYTVTLMGRTELLIISVEKLANDETLSRSLTDELTRFLPPEIGGKVSGYLEVKQKAISGQEQLINTGLVDGTNLLVMDMDLCVRCGRCSMACHQIHGQSRLVRRGINITRINSLKNNSVQQILSPSVCMHCKDPECLTGCPTGAIGRFSEGQIDIDRKTCIGCGDCATNCPYSAISMVQRAPPKEPVTTDWPARVRDMLKIKPDTLPPPVEQTDDLLAVKCNLCSGTQLNPPNSKSVAYGCEENCPTGALARVDPQSYFTEIELIKGPAFSGKHYVTGRNIHRSDPIKRITHLIGCLLALLTTAFAISGIEHYGLGERLFGFLNMRWITGIIGFMGIIGAMTYPRRRRIFKKRAGPLRYWMLAHIYLGVIGAVMIMLHGGGRSGGWLTTVLMLSFDLVILTGLFGVISYFALPRLLTQIEGEPLLIDDLILRRDELRGEIKSSILSSSPSTVQMTVNKVAPYFISLKFILRQYWERKPIDEMLQDARIRYNAEIDACTEHDQRDKLSKVIEAAAILGRVDALILLHRILKAWLPPHVIATSLMLVLLIIHLLQVIYGLS